MNLEGQKVLVIGRAGGIAQAIAGRALASGADVHVAGRNVDALRSAYSPVVSAHHIDVTEEASIAGLANRLMTVDHIVFTASARARGATADIDAKAALTALQTKVLGALLVAKHFESRINPSGSLTLASGTTSHRPTPNMTAVAATNGGVEALTRSLSVELAPVRVNAFSPGTVDSGAWDALGAKKADYLGRRAENNPAGRVGTPDDVATAVTFLMTNTFVTGTVLTVDGGESIA